MVVLALEHPKELYKRLFVDLDGAPTLYFVLVVPFHCAPSTESLTVYGHPTNTEAVNRDGKFTPGSEKHSTL